MRLRAALAVLLMLPGVAWGQAVPMFQQGTVLPNDISKFVRNGLERSGAGLLGDNAGVGVNPFAITDNNQLGLCFNSSPTSAANYTTFCIGHDGSDFVRMAVGYVGSGPSPGLWVQPFGGMMVGNPAGGFMGAETLNVKSLFVNGVAVATVTAGTPACSNIVAFGAVADGVFDNTAAFNLAKAASNCISFPPGVFRFDSGLTYNFTTDLKSLTIQGQGQDVTVLHFPNHIDVGLYIKKNLYQQSVHLRDFTMTTGTHNQDIGIRVEQLTPITYSAQTGYATNDIANITLRSSEGYFGPVTHSWSRGISLVDDSVYNIVGVSVTGPSPPASGFAASGGGAGDGIVIEGTSPKGPANNGVPVIFNIDKSNFTWVENGILIGNYTQGFQITQSNFVGCFSGIGVPVASTRLDQLAVSTSQFQNTNAINIGATLALLSIVGNTIYVPDAGNGLALFAAAQVGQITGNAILGREAGVGIGILIQPSAIEADAPYVITGNSFYRLADGIKMMPNARGHLVSANMYKSNTRNITNTAGGGTGITGATATLQPSFATVTGAVASGAITRLTVNQTATFFTGQYVLVGNVGGMTEIGAGVFRISPILVVDATHIDLLSINFGGTYTSGGAVSSLPP